MPDTATAIAVADTRLIPPEPPNLSQAPAPQLDLTVGQRHVIGAVTWEYVGQFGSEQVPPLPSYGNPYEVVEEPPDAGFPTRALGSRRYNADGSVWRAIAIDASLAYEQANDYLGFERFFPTGQVNPIPPQVWDALEIDSGKDPSTFVTGDEVYPPAPTDGMAYPESDHFNTIHCDYSNYYGGLGGGAWASDGYSLLHPNDVKPKHLLTTLVDGGESETPYNGDAGFNTLESGPVVRISQGVTRPNCAGRSV